MQTWFLPSKLTFSGETNSKHTEKRQKGPSRKANSREKNLMKEEATGDAARRGLLQKPHGRSLLLVPFWGDVETEKSQKSFLGVSESIRHLPKVTQLIMVGPELKPRSD